MIVLCSPRKLGKIFPIRRAYFSDGLVQPPTSLVCTDSDGVFELRCPLNWAYYLFDLRHKMSQMSVRNCGYWKHQEVLRSTQIIVDNPCRYHFLDIDIGILPCFHLFLGCAFQYVYPCGDIQFDWHVTNGFFKSIMQLVLFKLEGVTSFLYLHFLQKKSPEETPRPIGMTCLMTFWPASRIASLTRPAWVKGGWFCAGEGGILDLWKLEYWCNFQLPSLKLT